MTENIYRQKLANAVLYFAQNTKRLNMTKLSKLLCFFDFDHVKQTGYPSIGLEYYAFDNGPLPKKFWAEVNEGFAPRDIDEKVIINKKTWGTGKTETEFKPRPGVEVDFRVFTRREKTILDRLAFIYKDASGKTMSEISHEDKGPWEITRKEKGDKAKIDYILAIDETSDFNREQVEERLRDHFETLKIFDLEPVK